MSFLSFDIELNCIELAVHAAVEEHALLLLIEAHHHDHHVEADGAREVLGALVLEGRGLALVVHHEARPAVERVDLLRQAEPTQGLRALYAVVHLLKDVGARTGALTLDPRRLIRSQTVHICLLYLF